MRTTRSLIAVALIVAGCQTVAPIAPHSSLVRPRTSATGTPTAPSSLTPSTTVPADLTRTVTAGTALQLIGKAKLIASNGASVVDAATLVSDKGLGIVSNNGSAIISGNSGNYHVSAAPTESLLANATIEVLDGDGKVLVNQNGAPISAKTDASGNYTLNATLPDENLWLRVSLPDGDQLSALLVRDGSSQQSIDVDTASTLGATYVLNQYVKNSKAIYAKLPAADAQKLLADAQAAVPLLTALPSYKPTDVVAATDALRAKSTALDSELTHIKDILLVGQTNLGTGLLASKVPLTSPIAMYRDAAGDFFIAENIGRIRKVDANGNISLYAGIGNGTKTVQGTLGLLVDMVGKPDGTLYLAANADHVVRMISADGQLSTVAGGGTDTSGNGKATDEKLGAPSSVALGADGSLYILDRPSATEGSRVLKVDPQGNMTALPPLTTDGTVANGFALAVAADGTVYAARSIGATDQDKAIVCLPPGATSWQRFASDADASENEQMRIYGNALYYPMETDNAVLRFDLSTKLASPVVVASGPPLNGPFDVFVDGNTIWIDCEGDALIYQIAGGGTPQLFAGEQGINQIGATLGLALNAPGGIGTDGDGNLVFSEDGSNSIKRLVGDTVSLVAGGKYGHADGVGAAAQFARPTALAYSNGTLYVADNSNFELRAIAADGTVTTLAGTGAQGAITQALTPAAKATFGQIAGVAVDSKGLVYFTDATNNQVLRLDGQGNVALVAGAPVANGVPTHDYKGDGGPAAQAMLFSPSGLAFDKAGNLYVADSGNLCVRKIDTHGNISTVAGAGGSAAMLKLLSGQTDAGDVAASAALFMGPSGLCFDASGNLYISELGSQTVNAVSGLLSSSSLGFSLPNIPARIRKLSADGETVSIVAGPGGKVLTDPTAEDALLSPAGLAIDGQGRLAIVDTIENQLKILPAGSY